MDVNPRKTSQFGGHEPGKIAHDLELKLSAAGLGHDRGGWTGVVRLSGPGVNAILWRGEEQFRDEQQAAKADAQRLTSRLTDLLGGT